MLWPPAVAIRVPPKRDVPQQTPQRASPQARHGEPALLNTRACARLRSHQQHPPDDSAEAEAEASTTPALPITARAQTRTNERTEGKNKGVPRRRNCAKRRTDTQPQTDLRIQTRAETKEILIPRPRKHRAPARTDDPTRRRPRREIDRRTRPDRPPDRETDRPAQSELTSPLGASAARSSWPAHPNSGPASASKAAETAVGHLGRLTGMPAARGVAKAALRGGSDRQRSCNE